MEDRAMRQRRQQGFTLVELILVMVIVGIVAGILAMQLGPAFQGYAAVKRRAALTHQADTALRRIVAEVRTAVPNSLRLTTTSVGVTPKATCLEMVPTSDGGRFRTGYDKTVAAGASDPLDLSQPDKVFDVLTSFNAAPAATTYSYKGVNVGPDWVVIGNQNTDDVYSGADRAQLAGIDLTATPQYTARLTLQNATQFPAGYEGGRFAIVPDSQQAVTYVCSGAGLDPATGKGTGSLLRVSHYGFQASQTCPVATAGASAPFTSTVASKVSSCSIVYNPNQGATQQSGFVQLQLTLTDGGESVTLTIGSQVENVP
jgi:MSHA biogenesis protein MshO